MMVAKTDLNFAALPLLKIEKTNFPACTVASMF
jgi:hypothetical protein